VSAPQPQVNLRAERLNRGLSTREAAAKIRVSQAVLLRAERGEGNRPRHAKRIADFYKVKVSDFYTPPEGPKAAELPPRARRRKK
jgi:transcriptional regulator with XRE-family HTH domain